MRTWLLLALLSALFVAGCGGSKDHDRAAIRAALARSPYSYFHYRSPRWSGTRLRPSLGEVEIEDGFAVARASLPVGPRVFRTQWALLAQRRSVWRVLDTVAGRAAYLPCRASRTLMKKLAGGCAGPQPVNEGGLVSGPTAKRKPTRAERRRIVAVARHPPDGCTTYDVAISRIDHRYALVGFEFHKPYGNCNLFNGQDLVERTPSGWREVGAGSEPFPCNRAPPGVIRSLFGGCLTLK